MTITSPKDSRFASAVRAVRETPRLPAPIWRSELYAKDSRAAERSMAEADVRAEEHWEATGKRAWVRWEASARDSFMGRWVVGIA